MASRRTVGLLGLLGLLVGLAFGCRSEASAGLVEVEVGEGQVLIGGVVWHVDYDAALEIARAQDKALWVHFGENPG